MIRLNLPKEPYWLKLGDELALEVRPLTTAMWSTANARVREELRTRRDLQKTLAETNIKLSTEDGEYLPDYTDPAVIEGEGEALFCKYLAEIAVIDWKGVYDAGDAAVAWEPARAHEYIAALMDPNPDVATLFTHLYVAGRRDLEAEKKNYGRCPNGTTPTAAAPDTAATAPKTASPAPTAAKGSTANAAPISNTPRKPKKAGRHGTSRRGRPDS